MRTFWVNINKVRKYIQGAIFFFLFSWLLSLYFTSEYYNNLIFKRLQTSFIREQNEMELRIDNLTDNLSNQAPDIVQSRKSREFRDLASNRNIYLFVFKKDSLIIWSDNRIPEVEILPVIANENKLVQLTNGWFYSMVRTQGDYKIIGLLLIKNNYSIQNQYLKNYFNPIFKLPQNTFVKSSIVHQDYVISNNAGYPAFSVIFQKNKYFHGWSFLLIISTFLLSIINLLIAFRKFIKLASSDKEKLLYIFGFGVLLIFLKQLMTFFKFPEFLFQLSIFQPSHFALVNLVPSLGDLFILATIAYIIIYFAYTELHTELSGRIQNLFIKDSIRTIVLIFLILYFLAANELFEGIVFNSSISFDMHEFFDSGWVSFFSIVSIAILFAIFIFLLDYIYRTFFQSVSYKKTVVVSLVTLIITSLLYIFKTKDTDIASQVILILSLSLIIYIRKSLSGNYKYIHVIIMILSFSFYSVFVIYEVGKTKLINEKKLMAMNLAAEHDPIAEYLIFEQGNKINNDTIIERLVFKENLDYPWIYKYIRKKYFSGYWDRYDLQMTICKPEDSVLLNPDKIYKPCFDFFNSLISKHAEALKGTGYYFLKNSNGRISYLSDIEFKHKSSSLFSNLYIQLDSRLNTEELGYPELLLNEKFSNKYKKNEYSYAKYYKERLSYQTGNYLYNTSSNKYPQNNSQFSYETFGGYDHLLYKPDKDNLIILSKPTVRLFDLLVSFSYLFIFYFVILHIMLLLANPKWIKVTLQGGFKTRIRLSVMGILLLSLIMVAITTIYFLIEQYRYKHYEAMSQKLQSVYLELENNLSQETKLQYTWNSPEYNNLEELLRRLSNVLYTDINLYSMQGRMIATSRPELFDKGLSGTLMNPMAYNQLTKNNNNEYVQNEWLGNLKYASIYTPFINNQNQIIAYLNLPYFTNEKILAEDISNMLLAIINFYVILILISLSLAILISERITQPIKLIQDRLASIKLGMRSEKIVYNGTDEISELIEEYNRMVDELEHSVELLTKTERESAWREMAKQVAHEIKNPLTPMKLSIQQLQKAWNDKHEDFDIYLAHVSQTLIEQIENLSSIATEFSNFAKMPKAKNENLEILPLIEHTISLFGESGIEFKISNNTSLPCLIINADKEQISRVFINLITNSIQAIPEDKKGKISIQLTNDTKYLIIHFADNGKGIDEQLREKLFQPNFTTKSGGMGLGLAICKNILENANGSIRLDTEINTGATFILTIPLI